MRPLVILTLVAIVGVVVVSVSRQRERAQSLSAPLSRLPQLATNTPDPYPGGSGPVPIRTQTAIATGVYEGESHEDIADAMAQVLEDAQIAHVPPSPSMVNSADVTASDAELFDIMPEAISFQSSTDVALIFSGEFVGLAPGAGAMAGDNEYDYILVLVDTDSGSLKGWWMSDTLSELEARLP